MDPLNMYFLLKMGIFYYYVSLLEGICRGPPNSTYAGSWNNSNEIHNFIYNDRLGPTSLVVIIFPYPKMKKKNTLSAGFSMDFLDSLLRIGETKIPMYEPGNSYLDLLA